MKKIIALALALVMAMVLLCACGETLVSPEGVYSSDSGTYKVEFTGYNADENTGSMVITRTFLEVEDKVSGTYSVAVNDPDANTYFIDFTPNGGELIETFMIFDANDQVIQQIPDVGDIGGANICYYEGEPEA